MFYVLAAIGGAAAMFFGAIALLAFYGNFRRIVEEHQRGVLFCNGAAQPDLLDPGKYRINPFRDRVALVGLTLKLMEADGQDVITKDNVPVSLYLSFYYRVTDPLKVETEVFDLKKLLRQRAAAVAEQVGGTFALDFMLHRNLEVVTQMAILMRESASQWGVEIQGANLEVGLPKRIKQAFTNQACAQIMGDANELTERPSVPPASVVQDGATRGELTTTPASNTKLSNSGLPRDAGLGS
jgi:regulator of protease activity HflC (stomatin/prohibitin superfamily)